AKCSFSSSSVRRDLRCDLGRLHRGAGVVNSLQSAHDNLVTRLQAGFDHTEAIALATELNVLPLSRVIQTEDVDVLAVLVGQDSLVVDQECVSLIAARDLHARE